MQVSKQIFLINFFFSHFSFNLLSFDFETFLNCALEQLDACNEGSIDVLAYLFDIIRRNSLCYKSKIIDSSSSSESSSNIVTDL